MTIADGQPHDGGRATGHRVSHASLGVAAFSTVVEWYDFTLYLYFSTVLARVFFGGGEGALVTTLMDCGVSAMSRSRPMAPLLTRSSRLAVITSTAASWDRAIL